MKRWVFTLLLSLVIFMSPGVIATPLLEQTGKSMVAGTPAEADGGTFLKSLIDRIKAINDYWYESTLTTFSKGKPIKESGKFYFKAPELVRFEAISAGHRSGSIVVKQKNGKIKAKTGGLIGGLTLSLSPQSKLLRTSNGFNIIESDLVTLLEALRSELGTNYKCIATASPFLYPGLSKVYVLEFLRPGDSVAQRIALDPERMLPVAWSIFSDGKLFSVVQVSNMAINANIADDLFVLGGQAKGEKAMGWALAASDEILQSSISAMGAECIIDGAVLKNATQAISEIKRLTSLLEQTSMTEPDPKNPGKFAWSSSGRQVLISRTSQIELLTATLRNLQRAIQKFESSHTNDCEGVSAHWSENLDCIDPSISRLYAMFEQDLPDPQAIRKESKNISDQANFLDGVILRISESLP